MKRYCLKDEDLKAISKLVSIGLSVNDSIFLIKNHENEAALENLRNELLKGNDVKTVFSKRMDRYLKDHFLIFFECLPFDESLSLALTLKEENRKLLNMLIKKLSYPLGLFMVSFLGIYVFNNYFFDSLMNTLNSFSNNLDYLVEFKQVIDLITTLILILILIAATVLLFFIKPKNYIIGYSIICRFFKNNILKRYVTNKLIVYFKEMYRSGLKTRAVFDNLRKLKNNPIIAAISSRINNSLNEGKSFYEAMTSNEIDESFNYFVVLMDKSSNVEELLEDYYEVNLEYFKRLISRYTRIIETVSYGTIIFFIFFIYQVILSPLNMLAGI